MVGLHYLEVFIGGFKARKPQCLSTCSLAWGRPLRSWCCSTSVATVVVTTVSSAPGSLLSRDLDGVLIVFILVHTCSTSIFSQARRG